MKIVVRQTLMCVLLFSLAQCQFSAVEQAGVARQGKSSEQVIREPDPLSAAEAEVNGEYIKAFLVAYDVFKASPEISADKRQIENYIVQFRQDNNNYSVLFFAKRSQSEEGVVGGSTKLGRDVQYIISKKDYHLVGSNFFK